MSGVSLADDTQSNSRESSENKTERTEIRRGNKEYKSNNYVGSEIDYRKALDSNPSSLTATYNLGNSLYKQGKYSDAIKEYEKVVMSETDDKKLSEAWHNLGNSYFMEKNLPKSILPLQKASVKSSILFLILCLLIREAHLKRL